MGQYDWEEARDNSRHTAGLGGAVGLHGAGDIAVETELDGVVGVGGEHELAVLHHDVLAVAEEPLAVDVGPGGLLVVGALDKAGDNDVVDLDLADAEVVLGLEVACKVGRRRGQ